MMELQNKKIYVAGHRGMVGSAVVRKLQSEGCDNFLFKSSKDLDLRDQSAVNTLFSSEKPEVVVIAAAKVGGIHANNVFRADFLYDNLMIEANLIEAAFRNSVEKVLFLGSSCIYPKLAPQPLKEEYLLSDYLEFTNEPYAIAKIAGIKLCESYFRQHGSNFYSAMPTNLYGAYDNFNLQNSHVMPALMRKFHTAKEQGDSSVEVWGSGTPMREFLHVDDLADAVYFMLKNLNAEDIYSLGITQLNVGTGTDVTIAQLAEIIKKEVGFVGDTIFDPTKPDGTPRKLMDISRLHSLGWKHKIDLEQGIHLTYQWFLQHISELRSV